MSRAAAETARELLAAVAGEEEGFRPGVAGRVTGSTLPKLIKLGQLKRLSNDVPESARRRMCGLTMAGVLGVDPKTRRTPA